MHKTPQEFLRSGGTLKQLTDDFSIDVKYHGLYPNLVTLKYSMIDSPMSIPIVQECRGIILNQKDWSVVAWPFKKFFNYGESLAAPIDWTSARVLEKLDGSLMILYWHCNQWHVATSGTPDAMGPVNSLANITFKDLFWKVWHEKGYKTPHPKLSSLTFMFELMTPFNQVVVRHHENDLKLIGVRDRDTGEELSVMGRNDWGYQSVDQIHLDTIDAVITSFDTMDPLQQEGYVMVDDRFHRIKVKHPGYVALHHLKGDGFNLRRAAELVRSGEAEEILTYFPEWKEEFLPVQHAYADLVAKVRVAWDTHKPPAHLDRKSFALAVQAYPFSGVLFSLYLDRIPSIEAGLKSIHIDRLLDIMEL